MTVKSIWTNYKWLSRDVKVQTKVSTELLMGKKAVRPAGVQRGWGNGWKWELLEGMKPQTWKKKKKTGGRYETQEETWDQHRRQANQIPRMTVKGSLRIPAVKRV